MSTRSRPGSQSSSRQSTPSGAGPGGPAPYTDVGDSAPGDTNPSPVPPLIGPGDPTDMTPHARLAELAGLLAAGFARARRRWRGVARAVPIRHQVPAGNGLEPPEPPGPDGSPAVDAGREEAP